MCEQMSRWVGQQGDCESRESPRAGGVQEENGGAFEEVGMWLERGTERDFDCIYILSL